MAFLPVGKAELDGVRQGLRSFKMNLLDAQRQVVQKLDAELKRLEQLEIADACDALPTQVLEPGIGPGVRNLDVVQAWDDPKPPEVAEVGKTAAKLTPQANPRPSQIPSPTASNSMSAVTKNRRKHMSWIHKNADLPKAPKPGAKASTQPVFSQLHAQFAQDKVRQAAIQEFDTTLVEEVTETVWTRIVQHGLFERVSLLMIYLNALWLAVDIEFNDAAVVWQAEPIFIVVETLFVFYFVAEAFLRFMSYRTTLKALKDPWFIFDSLLVLMMLLETWIVPMFLLVLPESDSACIAAQRLSSLS